MKEIQLTRGYVALVDDEDYEWLSEYRWYPSKSPTTVYAVTNIQHGTNDWRTMSMHRLILGAKKGDLVDHRDRNGLNNQRDNIRVTSRQVNNINTRVRKDNTSGYRGVSFAKRMNKWSANIQHDGRQRCLGYFDHAEDAAKAYDAAALTLRGPHAQLNFPEEVAS